MASHYSTPTFQLSDLPIHMNERETRPFPLSFPSSTQSADAAYPSHSLQPSNSYCLPKRSRIWAHHIHIGVYSHWNCAYCPKQYKTVSGTGKPMKHLEAAHRIPRPTKEFHKSHVLAFTPSVPDFQASSCNLNDWSCNTNVGGSTLDMSFSPETSFSTEDCTTTESWQSADSWLEDLFPASASAPQHNLSRMPSSYFPDTSRAEIPSPLSLTQFLPLAAHLMTILEKAIHSSTHHWFHLSTTSSSVSPHYVFQPRRSSLGCGRIITLS
jgi:hypothetical protein